MKKILVILVMVAGMANMAMADKQEAAPKAAQTEDAPRFQVVSLDEVPEVVMNAFDAAYQNIGILKIEAAKVDKVTVYKFSIINYEKKEFAVYFSATGEELNM